MQNTLNFLKPEIIENIINKWGTPAFVYSEKLLKEQAAKTLAFSAPYGLTVRFAMKANPNRGVIKILTKEGIKIDASSGFEAERAILAGVKPTDVSVTAQEIPKNLVDLVKKGVWFNACSLHQLETFGKLLPGREVGVRINPGIGTGHSNKTNVGGPSSSFGIWYEHIDQISQIASKYKLNITRLHTHIGTGGDPKVWLRAAKLSLDQISHFPDVNTLDLGGGFKVARMKYEKGANLVKISKVINQELVNFYNKTGRKLHLEIEPGTFLLANIGSLITSVIDVVDTGKDGYDFIKIDSGMTEILRPSLYASQHPLIVVNDSRDTKEYVVVGHCCESGDLLTPDPDDPESISTRQLNIPQIGDPLVIEGVGAYCAHMNARNYNSFPASAEVILRENGELIEVARRQTAEEMLSLETY